MGNVFSSDLTREDHVGGESECEIKNMASSSDDNTDNQEFHDAIDEVDDREDRIKAKESEMEEFRRQLEIKREQRRNILDRHKNEKKKLEVCLDNERKSKLEAYESNKSLRELLIRNNIEIPEELQSSKENADIKDTIVNMKEEFEKLKASNNQLRRDLAYSNVSLQGAYSDIADLNLQNRESMKQINALKEVVAVSKTMLSLRENQLDELKEKLSEIERSLADREANMLSADLRQEYERQLQNIRSLRTLYEERARLAEVTRQSLLRELEEQKILKQAETEKVKDLTTKVQELETRVDELQETISNKNNQIYTCQDETRGLKTEMTAVNKLFSQVLLGYKNQKDLGKLVHRLEENHGILTHMAENENDSEASTALPKLLLEIVSQVDEVQGEVKSADEDLAEESNRARKNETDAESPVNTAAEEIVQNLPKVWRVLIELLSHQTATEDTDAEKVTTCYKTVETKTGPVQVPSVSQTYIRLKDLIVEKLGLIKEVNRMKQLNVHLETRLEEQERRLCLVTTELSKTWHVVGRLRRHHHQLHTHEKILKYELQQKRKLLTELKEELEYCREKWDQAREKNTQSEKDWKILRAEFSSRNTKSSTLFNNSAESGYSDERPSDESSESNDESEYVTEPHIRARKKVKKSFETILDSSTDRNLAAEREDPVSDMLDVADLPLDTQDGDDHKDVSHSCNSDSILKSDKICETEDEVGDLANDSCTEDHSTADHSQASDHVGENKTTLPTPTNTPVIDPAAILKSIAEQNERLAKKDKKLERLEKSGSSLLQKTQSTLEISDQINATLDHLLNRPSSSKFAAKNEQKNTDEHINKEKEDGRNDNKIDDPIKILNNVSIPSARAGIKNLSELNLQTDVYENPKLQKVALIATDYQVLSETKFVEEPSTSNTNDIETTEHLAIKDENTVKGLEINTEISDHDESISNHTLDSQNKEEIVTSEASSSSHTQIPTVDFKEILKNVEKQSERLAQKDIRLSNLEKSCSDVVNNLNSTLNIGEKLVEKLNSLQEKKVSDGPKEAHNSSNRDSSEPSTSSEVDHEALFAARDLRLKRLEEQTKSLVSKVNKTTDKGVKIHYKLEELHNIYGSESSRAGTPSDNEEKEGSDEKGKNNDDSSQNNGEKDLE